MYRRLLFLGVVVLVASLAFALGAPVRPASATETGTIWGRVMRDVDKDGDPADKNEPGLFGWTVVLERNSGGEPLKEETETDRNGRYTFEGLPAGEYDVSLPCAGQPSYWGYTTVEFAGWGPTLEAGGEVGDLNFPVVPVASLPVRAHTGTIVGRVVLDRNRDGVVQDSDPGMSGWHVTAESSEPGATCLAEQPATADVDTEGRFTLEHLAAGPYWVGLDPDLAPLKRYAVVSPKVADEVGGNTSFSPPEVDVPEGGVGRITIGVASLEGTASISGSVYADLNRSGSRDPGEPVAMTGCWMTLAYRFPDGYVGAAPQLANCEPAGVYEFAGLAPGDYMVGALYQFSPAVNPPAGADTASYLTLSLSEGERRTGVDFGYESVPTDLSEEPTPQSSPPPTVASLVPTAVATAAPPGASSAQAATGLMGAPSTGSGGASDTAGRGSVLAALLALGAAGALAAGSAFAARTRRR